VSRDRIAVRIRPRTSSGRCGEPATTNRSIALLLVRLTCCPPGPLDRTNCHSSASDGMVTSRRPSVTWSDRGRGMKADSVVATSPRARVRRCRQHGLRRRFLVKPVSATGCYQDPIGRALGFTRRRMMRASVHWTVGAVGFHTSGPSRSLLRERAVEWLWSIDKHDRCRGQPADELPMGSEP